jgi:hypothetical protein
VEYVDVVVVVVVVVVGLDVGSHYKETIAKKDQEFDFFYFPPPLLRIEPVSFLSRDRHLTTRLSRPP